MIRMEVLVVMVLGSGSGKVGGGKAGGGKVVPGVPLKVVPWGFDEVPEGLL